MSTTLENKLTIQFPTQGWRQILTSRKEILDAFDRARTQAQAEEVETLHGKVLEAAVRHWLEEFLPKRYGVTSGLVVSPGLGSNVKAPAFDVIIYDQLESPVLWVTQNLDSSKQGQTRAIPAEHVRLIIEVKASFRADNVRHAIAHLADLSPLLDGIDAPDERYKIHLPPTFRCGLLFGELRNPKVGILSGLNAVTQGMDLRGFFGGTILRREEHMHLNTGIVRFGLSSDPSEPFEGDNFALGATVQISNTGYMIPMLDWFEANFARFAFDLVAMLQGTYDPTKVSSFYGMGAGGI